MPQLSVTLYLRVPLPGIATGAAEQLPLLFQSGDKAI